MNRFRLKSGSFEIEIETDQAQTPEELAQAAISVVKAAPPTAEIIQLKELPALPTVVYRQPLGNDRDDQDSVLESTEKSRKRKTSSGPTADEKIDELISSGKFDVPMSLNEVESLLQRMALNFDKSTVANALASRVRKGRLERVGKKGAFKYVRSGVQVQEIAEQKIIDDSQIGKEQQSTLAIAPDAQLTH